VSHVLVVCARRYNGHELWTALGVIQQRGHTFELISTDYVIQDEITMQPNRIKRTIDDVAAIEMNDFDAFMIVSGNMKDTEAYWKDDRVLKYIDVANASAKPIAAICCSVPTVRQAATGKKVSFFPLVRSKQLLSEAGAVLQTVALTVDQNLVTAEHQMASQMWAEEFCNMIEGKPPEYTFVDSGYTPKGRERMPIPIVEELRIKAGGKPTEIHSPEKKRSYDQG
jgi:putative intracellular protease/amidase